VIYTAYNRLTGAVICEVTQDPGVREDFEQTTGFRLYEGAIDEASQYIDPETGQPRSLSYMTPEVLNLSRQVVRLTPLPAHTTLYLQTAGDPSTRLEHEIEDGIAEIRFDEQGAYVITAVAPGYREYSVEIGVD